MSTAIPAAPQAGAPRLRIGVFDSGVGGLSVMRSIRSALPAAEMLYVADSGHAPYGDRDEGFVRERAETISRFLLAQGADILVLACNTATAAAVAALRERHPAIPLVGVEPGIKPALRLSTCRRVGVLATTGTLASEKFRRLAHAHAQGAQLLLQPCPGLADAIEAASAGGQAHAVDALVERYSAALREAGVDVAVLGCTHYVFAADRFAAALPGVTLVDTADAVARQARRLAADLSAHRSPHDAIGAPGPLHAWSSGEPEALRAFAQRWLAIDLSVQRLPGG